MHVHVCLHFMIFKNGKKKLKCDLEICQGQFNDFTDMSAPTVTQHSTIQSVSTASPGQGYPRYAPTVLLKRSRIEVQSFQFWRIFFFRNSPLSITMVACIICILTWMRVTTVESYNASLWEKFKVNNSTLLCGLIALSNIETKNFKWNNFSGMKISIINNFILFYKETKLM